MVTKRPCLNVTTDHLAAMAVTTIMMLGFSAQVHVYVALSPGSPLHVCVIIASDDL